MGACELKASRLGRKLYRVHPATRPEDRLILDDETGRLYIFDLPTLERF